MISSEGERFVSRACNSGLLGMLSAKMQRSVVLQYDSGERTTCRLGLTQGHRLLLAIVFTFVGVSAGAATEEARSSSPPSACLPIRMPNVDALFSSRRKVFAHYFNRFPLSLDNKESSEDYYATEFLSPKGEHNKWLAQGGFLRSRPLPVPIGPANRYVVENLKKEVRLALSRGITGFTFDILSMGDITPGSFLPNMLEAASEVDPRFAIVLMPDMASFGPDVEAVINIAKSLYNNQGLFRLPDKRLVIAPFLAEAVAPEAWESMKTELTKHHIKIAFLPTFLNPKYISRYRSVGDGFGTFGTPLPSQGAAIKAGIRESHELGKGFMAGISGQGYRPKEYRFWESEGSLAYRNSWLGAIEGGADWVQLTTWNDFSESTQIIPYTDGSGSVGTGYFNLTGFYAAWFLTGQRPTITHDVLYYFYRRHSTGVPAPKAGEQSRSAHFWQPGKDNVELVGFLKEPGILSISVGGKIDRKSVGSGVQSFSVPLASGRPRFSLQRSGGTVISFEGTPEIVSEAPGGYADLTLWSGSASSEGTCYSDAIRWP